MRSGHGVYDGDPPLLIHATSEADGDGLALLVYSAGRSSFNNSVAIVSGATEAIVVDAGYTRADALRIAAAVLDSGRRLSTIFISNADPDYYFGVATLKSVFPHASVLATRAVRDRIAATIDAKFDFWAPKIGVNAPLKLVVPDVLERTALSVDGHAVEIRGTDGALAHRPYVWIPSLRAIVGNVGIFGGLHVWTADTPSASERAAWIAQLDEMGALAPRIVVPGHMARGTPLDRRAIAHTRAWLRDFEALRSQARGSRELIDAMKARYPAEGFELALELGAAVASGERQW